MEGTLDPITGQQSKAIWIELNGQKSHVANTTELRQLIDTGESPTVHDISNAEFDSFTDDLQPFLNPTQQAQQTVKTNLESLRGPEALASGLTGNDFNIPDTFGVAIPNPNQVANKNFLFAPGAQDDPRSRTLLGALGGSDIPPEILRRMIAAFRPSTIGSTAQVGFG